jgi:hypothetical protein
MYQLLGTGLLKLTSNWYARDALKYAEEMRFESRGPHRVDIRQWRFALSISARFPNHGRAPQH